MRQRTGNKVRTEIQKLSAVALLRGTLLKVEKLIENVDCVVIYRGHDGVMFVHSTDMNKDEFVGFIYRSLDAAETGTDGFPVDADSVQ